MTAVPHAMQLWGAFIGGVCVGVLGLVAAALWLDADTKYERAQRLETDHDDITGA